jgi:hypothetical protein
MDTQMDEHTFPSKNNIPFFDETNYMAWEIKMKGYLKSKGVGFWDTVVTGSIPLKKNSKFVAQKEAKKNNIVAFKTIFNGLSSSVKEIIG